MEIIACRICLATDVKLYNLNKFRLDAAFSEITGITTTPSDGLPQHICFLCCAQVQKQAAFRSKCHYTDAILRDIISKGHEFNTEEIKNIYRIQSPITLVTVLKNIDEECTEVKLKEEPDNDENTVQERFIDIEVDNIDIKDDDISIKDDDDFSHDDSKNDILQFVDVNLNDNKTIVGRKKTCKKERDGKVKTEKKKSASSSRKRKTTKVSTTSESDDSDDEILAKMSKKILTNSSTKVKSKKKGRTDSKEHKVIRSADHKALANKYNMDVEVYTKEEQLQQFLERKDSEFCKRAKVVCQICFKGFMTDSAYKNHMKNHDPKKGRHECALCKLYFPSFKSKWKHEEQHRVKYTCRTCRKTFSCRYQMQLHFGEHNGFKIVCEICDRHFVKKSSFFNHQRLSHGKQFCDLCGVTFASERGMDFHLRKSHEEAVICSTCGKRFLNKEVLNRHGEYCSSEIWPCVRCGDGFTTESLLAEHVTDMHKPEKFSCELCNKSFVGEGNLGLHWQTVHKRMPRKTRRERGDYGITGEGDGFKDEKRDSNEWKNQVICEHCGKSYRSRAHLAIHITIHTGEKPHKCPLCPKTFRLAPALKMHMFVHNDERPFSCPHCPARFRQSIHRKQHILIHTQEKPHTCEVCGKGFSLSCNMKEHIRVVHAGLPPRRRPRTEKRTKKY